jgi:hypothetical protein
MKIQSNLSPNYRLTLQKPQPNPPEPPTPPTQDQVDIAQLHLDRGLGLLWGAALGGLVASAGGSALTGAVVGGLLGSLAGPAIGLSDHLFDRPNSPLK